MRFALFALTLLALPAAPAERYLVYFGTGADGIYAATFDSDTGALEPKGVVASIDTPNFLEVHPSGGSLYAASRRMEDGQLVGRIAAFSIERPSGMLTPLNEVGAQGLGPAHVDVHDDGRVVAIANYGSGSAASYRIGEDGKLEPADVQQHEGSSVHPTRQNAPHAHSVNFSPGNRYLVAADLGLDKLLVYRVDPDSGELEPAGEASVEPGAGPRHFAFHPSGKFAYSINELASTITAFRWDEQTGELESIDSFSTLPPDFEGDNTTAEIRAHPNGRFIYGSNRGHDSIAIFSVDEQSGKLTFVGAEPTGGRTPRNFNLDPTGRWLFAANQDSDTVVLFQVDPESGKLAPAGKQLEIPRPMCVRFTPLEKGS